MMGIALLGAVLAWSPSSCGPPGQVYPAAHQYPLRHSFSLSPGIAPGVLTSCYNAPSDVPGRKYLCRAVYGDEEVGSNVTYYLDGSPWAADNTPDDRILSVVGIGGPYGATVVTASGEVFEGCTWASPSNNYTCDYHSTQHFVLQTSGEWHYFLAKLWDWTHYAGNAAGCATGVAAILAGSGRITFPLLTGCVDTPL
jgi:hypothetical protein